MNLSRRYLHPGTDIQYAAIMISTLEAAIAELAALPLDEQDRVRKAGLPAVALCSIAGAALELGRTGHD